MEKIGIVTITYNSKDVLQPFLRDILAQKHQNFILYIIDNGSTDTTIPLLQDLVDKRIKIIINRENIGVAKANTQGLRQAIQDGCDQVLIINNDL